MNPRHPLVALAVVLLGFAALVPSAPAASAAPPTNDDAANATLLGPAPFHLEQNTTEATSSAEEAALQASCPAPVIEHGVWFTATATADANVVADVTASDFSAGIIVLRGDPGNLEFVTCAPGVVSGPVTAGETLYLLVFGDGGSEATSGNLVLDTYLAPSVDVTIDPRGTVDKSGTAHISGTVTCTSDQPEAVLLDVSGSVRQKVGRGFVDGFFFTELSTPCDGVTRPWAVEAVPDGGKFAGGKAATAAVAFGCDNRSCSDAFTEATIQLSRRKE